MEVLMYAPARDQDTDTVTFKSEEGGGLSLSDGGEVLDSAPDIRILNQVGSESEQAPRVSL